VLAGAEGLDHEGAVRPSLREDRHRVDIGGEDGVEVVERAVEVLRLDELRCAVVDEVGHEDPVDVGVELEQLRELRGELACADHSD